MDGSRSLRRSLSSCADSSSEAPVTSPHLKKSPSTMALIGFESNPVENIRESHTEEKALGVASVSEQDPVSQTPPVSRTVENIRESHTEEKALGVASVSEQDPVSQTPPVSRNRNPRGHSSLSRSRLRELRALSMPDLDKLCTEDFASEANTVTFKTELEIRPRRSLGATAEKLTNLNRSGKEEVYFVVLTKEEGSGLGFSIAGGVDLEQKCVTVHRVFSRGIAGLEGTIQRGDNIISISGTPLGGASHGDALSVLHQARLPKQALVVIRRGKESEPLSPRQEVPASGGRQSQSTRDVTMETGTGLAVDLGDAISVELQKTSAGLGFSLDGGKASVHGDRPLYIKRIFKGTLLCQNRNSTLNDVSLVYLLLVVEIKTKRGFRGSRVTHPVKVLLLECRMHPIAWMSAVQVQAIRLPTVDRSSQGMEHNWPSTAQGAERA
ncbi:UNVERIFIED_CONTAM: hypothetical protein FKN15_023713 [Acipenser sinensis]